MVVLQVTTDPLLLITAQVFGSSVKRCCYSVGNNAKDLAGVDSEAGMLRYNTEDERTEDDGTNWTSVAGSPGIIEMMQKQLTENVLILDKNMATTFRKKCKRC